MKSFTHLCLLLLSVIILPFAAFAQKDSGYFSSFDKTKIYYQVQGKGSPVLLIHGFTGRGSDWKKKPLYDSLIANGFKVILVDLRGGGLSDKPHQAESYANDAEARDLIGLLKWLGVKTYDAVGYSRGSIILARLLVLDKNIQRAVIGGMGIDFSNPMWPRRIAIYEALMFDSSGFDGLKQRIATSGMDRLALAYQQKEQPSTSKEALAKVKQKVLIICGDKDEDNGNALQLQQAIPGSSFASVPGDHNSAWGTKEFAAETVSFLKK